MKESLQERIDKWIPWLLPLPFLGTPWWNILLFPFGIHACEPLRKAIVYGVTILLTLLLFVKALTLWREKRFRKLILLTAGLPVVFGLFYLGGLVLRTRRGVFLLDAVTGGCGIVACCSAILIVLIEKRERELFRAGRIYAVVTAPIMLYYCIRLYLPTADYSSSDLGVLSYMPLAYCSLTVCILLFLDAAIVHSAGKWGKTVWLDLALFTLYAAAIPLSGTRGTVLCLLFFALLLPFFWWKDKRNFGFSIIAFTCILLFSTVLSPSPGENRITKFVDETISSIPSKPDKPDEPGEPSTPDEPDKPDEPSTPDEPDKPDEPGEPSTPDEPDKPDEPGEPSTPDEPGEPDKPSVPDGPWSRLSAENLNAVAEIVSKADPSITDNPLNHIVDIAYYTAPQLLEEGKMSETDYARLIDMTDFLSRTSWGGRLFLWVCAVHEIQAAPLTGHGVLYFQDEYGTYPHNYFLEIGVDFGLIAMLAVLALGIYTFLKLLLLCRDKPLLKAWLLYVFASLPRYMLGTSMYAQDAFVQLGICVVLMIALKNHWLSGETELRQ